MNLSLEVKSTDTFQTSVYNLDATTIDSIISDMNQSQVSNVSLSVDDVEVYYTILHKPYKKSLEELITNVQYALAHPNTVELVYSYNGPNNIVKETLTTDLEDSDCDFSALIKGYLMTLLEDYDGTLTIAYYLSTGYFYKITITHYHVQHVGVDDYVEFLESLRSVLSAYVA